MRTMGKWWRAAVGCAICFVLCAAGAVQAAVPLPALFSFAERTYPQLFPGTAAQGTLLLPGFGQVQYRFYAASGNYLGVAEDGRVLLYGPASQRTLAQVARVADFSCEQIGCPPTGHPAEGVWTGTSSAGMTVRLIVLENGEAWGMYEQQLFSRPLGILYGNVRASGSAVSGTGLDIYAPNRSVTASSFEGAVEPRQRLAVNTFPSGLSISAAYDVSYDQPASLAALTGRFVGQATSKTSSFSPLQPYEVTISATGRITMAPYAGCSGSGLAKPRAGGKGVFEFNLTFSGSSCALGNGAVASGLASYSAASGSLFAVGLNAGRTDGFTFRGQKQ